GITSLDLSGFWVEDDDLRYLANHPDLEVLSLSGSPISGSGLSHLTGLKKLRYLNLNGTAIATGKGLDSLSKLKWVTDVSLAQTGLTEEKKDSLENEMPRVRIHGMDGKERPRWLRIDWPSLLGER